MAETDGSTPSKPGPNIPPLDVTLEHVGSGARRQGVVVNCERSGRHAVARIRMGLAGLFHYRLTNGYGHEKSCQYWRVVEADELRAYAREHFGLDVQAGPSPRLKITALHQMGPQVGAARRSAKLKRLHPKQTEMFG